MTRTNVAGAPIVVMSGLWLKARTAISWKRIAREIKR
jgi:hypothetical protein